MLLTSRPLLPSTVLLLAIAFGACSEGPTAPPAPGIVQTTIVTTGGDPDTNGYDLSVGPIVRQSVASNGTLISDVPPGTHSITVEGVAENCSVSGPNPRTVTVAPGARVNVDIKVVCVATGIEIRARTAGAEHAPTHQISLNDRWAGMVGANASVVISRLQPGTYTVSLDLFVDHCRVSGSHSVTIEVKTQTITPVSFDIACVAPTRADQIAFTDGNLIKMVNIDGTGTTGLVVGHSPSWSPDGSHIVFSDASCDFYNYECTGGIAVLHMEAKNVRRLDQTSGGMGPAWAPRGDTIAFVDMQRQLTVATLDASPAVLLATPEIYYLRSPSWSPDGQRIVFSCTFPGATQLCAIDKDGTKFERLTSGSGSHWEPDWGPHGRIAFIRSTGNFSHIVILDADGRTTTIAEGVHPAWSRDGSQLVFAGTGGLFIVDSDGRNLRRLTSGNHYHPAWRP